MDANHSAERTIDALLQQRAQYEQWLARLDATGNKAPAAVRERVRSDYESRLRQVIDELRGHSATIAAELEHHRADQERLEIEQSTGEETLAEAEVRYTVGEYDDTSWHKLREESEQYLDRVRGELEVVCAEIDRLAEVQALISGSPRTCEEDVVNQVAAVVAEESAAPEIVPAVVPAAPAAMSVDMPEMILEPALSSAPSPAPVSAPARQLELQPDPVPVASASSVDELAFLKSVADEEQKPMPTAPRRASTPPSAAKPVETSVAPVSAPTPAPTATPATAAPAGAAKAAGMAKTLKCNECGTFNRPTEWYCERCGAELAAL